jgi:hypothetical protein
MVKLYSKNRQGVKIIRITKRSLHTIVTEVCFKSHFFISLTRIEKTNKAAFRKKYEKNNFFFIFSNYR